MAIIVQVFILEVTLLDWLKDNVTVSVLSPLHVVAGG